MTDVILALSPTGAAAVRAACTHYHGESLPDVQPLLRSIVDEIDAQSSKTAPPKAERSSAIQEAGAAMAKAAKRSTEEQ